MTGKYGHLTDKAIHSFATMEPPNWSQCIEQELWRYVAWHLEGEGIRPKLVGGEVSEKPFEHHGNTLYCSSG